jgi:ubiquinone/menaquinone biosynthesis C-methylase UbiE
MTRERIGLDPLASSYRELGTSGHRIRYIAAHAESMPFRNECFDFATSFNSLDHLDDLEKSIRELARVTASGGSVLLLTEVGHSPTECEPQAFSFDVVNKFIPAFKLVEESHYEKSRSGIYESILAGIPYDHGNPTSRYGVLSARFIRSA